MAEHSDRHGNYFQDVQILESTRSMGTGKAERERRIVYQWSFKRQKRDDRNINLMIDKAERHRRGQGTRPATIDRARPLPGLKGYVTNLDAKKMPGAAVISAYHDLWEVEASFRMTKRDLKARPVFHREPDAIETHLTVVFAALAISRHLQDTTGMSIKKIVRTLRTARSARSKLTATRRPSTRNSRTPPKSSLNASKTVIKPSGMRQAPLEERDLGILRDQRRL
jgi:transposase